jgi:hypothetical protein
MMAAPVPQPTFTAEQVDAAVQLLGEHPERFEHAQEVVGHAAPGLRHVLDEALEAGGWFGAEHESEIAAVSAIADIHERLDAVRTLVSRETRVGMLVGVAVGFELHRELHRNHDEKGS